MRPVENPAPGTVRCVFSTAPLVTIEGLLARGAARPEGERVIVCEIDLSRPVFEFTTCFVHALANAALAVWPDWYDRVDLFLPRDDPSWQSTWDCLASARAATQRRSIIQAWLRQAVPRCRAGRPPVVSEFPPTVQLQQLALAIAETDLVIAIRTRSEGEPEPAGLLGLSRSLEWLSRQVSAHVVAVLPAVWAGRTEFDSISWECQRADEGQPLATGTESPLDEPPAMVSPIRGRPHPNSPGEQLMASRLERDPALGPLFQYNVPVTTVRSSRYQVDIVWYDGKIVVEIDGYRCHSSRFDFANDRQRDYELQLSGYLVLRLPHDGVMADVELAVDKIRDLVNLRKGPTILPRPSV